jgi:DNA-binding MarR family transcriptional regulator
MPGTTAFAIFKELKQPVSISDLGVTLGLDHSTISLVVSSFVEEGFVQKQRDGKKVFVKRANTLHARSLEEFLKEYPRLPIEEMFSYSSLEILSLLTYPHTLTDIVAMTGLNRHTVSTAILKLSRYGIVLKEKRRFVLNKRHRNAADFVSYYWRYIANQRLLNIAEDGIILFAAGSRISFQDTDWPGTYQRITYSANCNNRVLTIRSWNYDINQILFSHKTGAVCRGPHYPHHTY